MIIGHLADIGNICRNCRSKGVVAVNSSEKVKFFLLSFFRCINPKITVDNVEPKIIHFHFQKQGVFFWERLNPKKAGVTKPSLCLMVLPSYFTINNFFLIIAFVSTCWLTSGFLLFHLFIFLFFKSHIGGGGTCPAPVPTYLQVCYKLSYESIKV